VRKKVLIILCFSLFVLLLPMAIHAEIVVYDSITAFKRPVMLKALTKGIVFPKGGVLVDFFVNGKHIGKTLSGGDGYAFFKYIPPRYGLNTVMVKSIDESAEGSLLVARKKENIVLLGIEGTIIESILSREPRKGSVEGIKKIMGKYRVIYLTSMLGLDRSRKWLKEGSLPLSLILRWTGVDLLDELCDLGIKIIAIIGSASLIEESSEHVKKRYSFDDTENGIVVKDWNELVKKLNVE
jgi:hypothetical protein